MRELGHLNKQPQLQHLDKLEKVDRFAGQKVENVDLDTKPKYTIDEILDKVEDGDISILVELGISYTEITTETGDKKISFKYEGTRYTVNIIKNSEEKEQSIKKTRRQNFDDGSYSIYEMDEAGRDLKRTDYKADGSIQGTLEFTYNDDGTVIHTYKTAEYTQITNLDKNGNVVHNSWFNADGSLRETADYTRDENGVETTITRDANGTIRHKDVYDWKNNKRIAKETYDAKGNLVQYDKYEYAEDGSLISTTYDANDKIITIAKYNADGSIEKIEYYGGTENILEETNFYYDSEGKRLEITTDSQNQILVFRQFDKKGKLIFSFDPKDYNLQDLQTMKNILEKQLEDIAMQIRSLDVPTPPNAMDFKKSSGDSIDENAYNKAMQQYNEQMIAYHNKVDELNKKSMEIQNKLQQVNKQITELELNEKFENIENTINSLKETLNSNNELISILETTLENIKKNLKDLPNKKLELQNKMQNIYAQMLSMQVPTPPSVSDYKKTDGSVDEKAYEEAFNNYESQKYEYDRIINQLNAEISILRNEIAKIDMEVQKQTSDLNQLEKNINAVKTIQDLIDGIEDKESNKDLIAQLNKILEDLYKNIKSQNEVRRKMDVLYDTFMSENIPTPPSTNDYKNPDGSIDEAGYSKAFAEYEKAKAEYERKMQQYNSLAQQSSNMFGNLTNQVSVIVFNATVSVVENKIAGLRESGNNEKADELENKLNNLKKEYNSVQKQRKSLLNRENMLLNRLNRLSVPVPPSTNDYRTDNDSVDEQAYEKAMQNYEKQKNKYDRITSSIFKQLDIISEKLKVLDNKMTEIQENVMNLT